MKDRPNLREAPPGYYRDAEGEVWLRQVSGADLIANGYVVHYRDSQLDAVAESFGPFTELRVEDP